MFSVGNDTFKPIIFLMGKDKQSLPLICFYCVTYRNFT